MAEEIKFGVSRRTLAKGAAWTVPAVAVAAAAPAYAKSGVPIVIDFDNASACKIPGKSMGYCYNKGYVLWAEFDNTSAIAVEVTITGMTVGGVSQCIVGVVDYTSSCNTALSSNTFTVPANGTRYIGIYSNASSDSGSDIVAVSFDYTPQGEPKQSDTQDDDLKGGSWSGDTGQGSCKFPTQNFVCDPKAPLSACNTSCGDGTAIGGTASNTDATDGDAVTEEKAAEPIVEEKPVIEEPKEEIQPVIEAEVTEGAPAETEAAPADAEADA